MPFWDFSWSPGSPECRVGYQPQDGCPGRAASPGASRRGAPSGSQTCFGPSESPFPLECRMRLAHVGIFSDDSNCLSARDNICVSTLFYLPSLPLASTTRSHASEASAASVRGRHLGQTSVSWPPSADDPASPIAGQTAALCFTPRGPHA